MPGLDMNLTKHHLPLTPGNLHQLALVLQALYLALAPALGCP